MLLREATGCVARGVQAGIAACAVLALGLWAELVSAQAAPDPQALAEATIRRLDLQTELTLQPKPFWWLNLELPPETIWLVVAAGLGVLAYVFRDMIPILGLGRGPSWADQEGGSSEPGSAPPEMVLGAADDLAARGRFVEAMHTLLLQALAEIRRRLDEQFADSMTSREILRSSQVSDALRVPLRDIVHRVEWSYFGEHPAARDDYAACRASFTALAHALHGSAA